MGANKKSTGNSRKIKECGRNKIYGGTIQISESIIQQLNKFTLFKNYQDFTRFGILQPVRREYLWKNNHSKIILHKILGKDTSRGRVFIQLGNLNLLLGSSRFLELIGLLIEFIVKIVIAVYVKERSFFAFHHDFVRSGYLCWILVNDWQNWLVHWVDEII